VAGGHHGGLPRRPAGPDPGDTSPARPRKPIPAGYVLVGQQVDVQRGAKTAGAALKFTCPDGKRLKTFGLAGHAGFLAAQNYEDHKTTNIMSFPPPHKQQASGTVYAVCR
jgi:hypothetical protein